MTKGENSVFSVPEDYVPEKYKPIITQISNRLGADATEKNSSQQHFGTPLGDILSLGRKENFSLFIPKHRRLAGRLIDIFLGVRSTDDLLSVAVYARDRVNPYLFNYAFSVALLHRPDTQDLDIPSVIYSFPDKYVDAKVFRETRESLNVLPKGARRMRPNANAKLVYRWIYLDRVGWFALESRSVRGLKHLSGNAFLTETIFTIKRNIVEPIEISKDYTASDLEPEHRLAYFREDMGINLHHWHWHLVYPFEADRKVVDKNRRGELFYYMHQQIMGRYNFERLSNNMKRAERFIDWRSEIKEAYFPKLDSLVASRFWPARMENQKLSNLRREVDQINIDIDELERWNDRIFEAINSGVVRTEQGEMKQLTEFEGIDILGNMVESSILSPDRSFYGDLHNMGHVFISYIHDPDHRHLEAFGVIGDSATAMRDPAFYRWHAYIDFMFQKFKSTLPRYTEAQLSYSGITVDEISLEGGDQKNVFDTFWQQSDVDLSRGMDFQPRGSVFIRFTHLQHQPFTYKIIVNNSTNGSKQARAGSSWRPRMTRGALPGHSWSRGICSSSWTNLQLTVSETVYYTAYFTLSRILKQGKNTINRSSGQSSVTIPFERSFRDLDTNRPEGGEALAQFNFCGCGWPEHMLIPMGKPEGMECELFVMISNYDDDKVSINIRCYIMKSSN
ncbi:hypothetical protein NQ318_008424 [Aromia moschata]|uniref:Tyrosinase copper-binding domain-containing protein n=1 Tax=Aromia moschata TaxID=1265417 RepID=A0AAV8Y917_9CUCU|nr:hypothetical protein NQ318_008424 [Aromia moschata]